MLAISWFGGQIVELGQVPSHIQLLLVGLEVVERLTIETLEDLDSRLDTASISSEVEQVNEDEEQSLSHE